MRWSWVAVALVVMAPDAARAGARSPELSGTLGGTFAVRSGPVVLRDQPEAPLLKRPDGGGSSASLAVLWPVDERLSFGVMLHLDDAGTVVDSVRDAGGRGLDYGKFEQFHRSAWGASWRLDASGRPWHRVIPRFSATWGYYRIVDDQRGTKQGTVGSTGFSLAPSLRMALGSRFALGVVARYHRLFNDREGRFMSAGLEGSWR